MYDQQGNLHGHLVPKLAPTWRVVYEHALATSKRAPIIDWSLPSVWNEAWASRPL